MSAATVPRRTSASSAAWSRVDDDLIVGTYGGDFHGYVDRRDEHTFVAFDHFSRCVGTFPRLSEAKAAIDAASGPSDPSARSPWLSRVLSLVSRG